MESDSWSRLSAASIRHHSTLQSRFDLYSGGEDAEGGEDEPGAEFACPFCAEDFDVVGLCCHIDDEHPVEAKNGACPVCAARVGMELVGHITMQHENIFKVQRRRRVHKGSSGSHSTFSLLRKELCDGNLHSHLGGAYMSASSNSAPDPLLSSFITNFPVHNLSRDVQPETLDEGNMVQKASHEKTIESIEPALSDKDQEERARRCEFAQGLMLSTIFDDDL